MPDPILRDRLDAPGLAATVACCMLWAGNAVAVKYAVPGLPPLGCASARFLLGMPVVALICRSAGQPLTVPRRLWGLLFVHGVLAALQIGCFNWGAGHSQAGRSSVFVNVHPLVVAPLAWLLLGERLGPRGLAGLLAAVIGVAILLSEPLRRGGGLVGDVVVLISGVLFGIQTIAQKKTFPFIAPTTLLFTQSAVAAVLTATYSAVVEGTGSFHVTPSTLGGVAYQGLAVSGVCFALWMLLLRRYPAGQLVTVSFLTPLFGVALGHLLRNEPLTTPLLLGGGLVGLAIFLVASDHPARPGLPGEDAP